MNPKAAPLGKLRNETVRSAALWVFDYYLAHNLSHQCLAGLASTKQGVDALNTSLSGEREEPAYIQRNRPARWLRFYVCHGCHQQRSCGGHATHVYRGEQRR